VVASRGTEQPRAQQERVEELFKAHASTVYAYAVRRGARHADAEDIVAAAFLVCFRRSREVPEDALPWLLGVARKVLAHRVRAERRRRLLTAKLLEGIADPTRHAYRLTTDAQAPVFTAFRRLPLREREVVRLVVLEDLDSGEAAKALGLTRKAVYCHLARARAKLKALLPDAAE
jgi:RNA polymerase sigma-70 factor (ECF subfamily)